MKGGFLRGAFGIDVRVEVARDINNAELLHFLEVLFDSFFSELLVRL